MKFTLRDVFWLIALAALACGWFVDHRAQSIAHSEDRKYWDRTNSLILHAWREGRAENQALKMAVQQQVTQP